MFRIPVSGLSSSNCTRVSLLTGGVKFPASPPSLVKGISSPWGFLVISLWFITTSSSSSSSPTKVRSWGRETCCKASELRLSPNSNVRRKNTYKVRENITAAILQQSKYRFLQENGPSLCNCSQTYMYKTVAVLQAVTTWLPCQLKLQSIFSITTSSKGVFTP